MKICYSIIIILISSAAVFAQTVAPVGSGSSTACDLRLEVYKLNASAAAPAPIQIKAANAILKNSKTQKEIKAELKNDEPFFSKLTEGDYEAVVSFPGYKTMSTKFSLDCGIVNTQNVATKVIFLSAGNPAEIMSMRSETLFIGDDPFAPSAQLKEVSPLASRPGASLATPVYPPAARAVHATGAVRVQVLLDELGRVVSAKALDGHPLLRQSAENAARASKFTPTMQNGVPVQVSGVIVYNFGQ